MRSVNVIIGLMRAISEVRAPFSLPNVTNFPVRQSKVMLLRSSLMTIALAVCHRERTGCFCLTHLFIIGCFVLCSDFRPYDMPCYFDLLTVCISNTFYAETTTWYTRLPTEVRKNQHFTKMVEGGFVRAW